MRDCITFQKNTLNHRYFHAGADLQLGVFGRNISRESNAY